MTQRTSLSRPPARLARRRGIALMLVIVSLAVAGTLAVAFIAAQGTTTGIMHNAERTTRARTIAEAALQMAISEIKTNADWRTAFTHGQWVTDASHGGGTFSLWGEDGRDLDGDGVINVADEEGDGDLADDQTDYVTLTVVARYDTVVHKVQAVVTPGGEEGEQLVVLLVVDDADSLTAGEAARRSLIESWNYDVIPISDSASQSEFDAALLTADVVYVTCDTSASSVGSKLASTALGVVVEEAGLFDEQDLSSTSGSVASNTIEITDNTHYITSPFSMGSLTIHGGAGDLVSATGTVSPGGSVLAESSGGAAQLVAIDMGGQTHDGDEAVGRRVALPWGQALFAFENLNTDGKLVMRRALDWCALPPAGPPALAHWRLDDGSGLIATDSNGGHDGTVNGGAPWVVGQVGGGMEFDGGNDFIKIDDHDDFDVTDALTITAWIRPQSFGSGDATNIILRKGEGNPNVWQFALDDGRITLYLDEGDDAGTKGDTVLEADTWYHVAATWDGSTIRLFINGESDNGNGDSRSGTIGTDNRSVYLGGRAGTDPFEGTMDDVRFYNRALNPLEIRAMYEEGTATNRLPAALLKYDFEEIKPSATLVSHWTLDESGSGGGGLAASDQIILDDSAEVDSYLSSSGAYSPTTRSANAIISTNSTSNGKVDIANPSTLFGDVYVGAGGDPDDVVDTYPGSITGDELVLDSNVNIPNQSAPSGMPSSEGDQTYTTTQTWTSDRKFGTLVLDNGAQITINGNVRVQCTTELVIKGQTQIIVPAGSSLELYSAGNILIDNDAVVNADTTAPSRVLIVGYNTGDTTTIKNKAQVSAVLRVDHDVLIDNEAEFYGSLLVGDDITIKNTAKVHLDLSLPSVGIEDPPANDETLVNAGLYRNSPSGGQAGAAAHTGTSVQFDGSNDYVEIPHDDSYLLRSGAIAFWFRADSVLGNKGLFSKDSSGYDNGGQVTISMTGATVRARLESSSAQHDLVAGPVLANTWYHVVLTFGPDGMHLFLNGTEASSSSYTGGLGATSGGSGNTEPIALGVDTSTSGNGTISGWSNPFAGRMDDVRIYNYALDATQVGELYAGNSLSESTLPPSVVPDTSGYGASLDLFIEDTSDVDWLVGGGLEVLSDARLEPAAPGDKVVTGVTVENAVSVEVEIQTDSNSQSGPARIVAFGQSATDVNFFLGQDGQNLVVRIRTTDTGSNASPDIVATNVLDENSRQHVVVAYDGAEVRIYIDGTLAHSEEHTGGLTSWDDTGLIAVANDPTTAKPWLGKLYKVVVWDQALGNAQVGRLVDGEAPGLPGGIGGAFTAVWTERP